MAVIFGSSGDSSTQESVYRRSVELSSDIFTPNKLQHFYKDFGYSTTACAALFDWRLAARGCPWHKNDTYGDDDAFPARFSP